MFTPLDMCRMTKHQEGFKVKEECKMQKVGLSFKKRYPAAIEMTSHSKSNSVLKSNGFHVFPHKYSL